MTKEELNKYKMDFKSALVEFVDDLRKLISTNDGQWTIKGFIDVFKNIYTISSDTKIVSKILEIHLFPEILKFAKSINYNILLAEKQNWYPDLTFVKNDNENVKFAVDLKTTYRDPIYPGHINGFTLGSHGTYFKDRKNPKNIQFPYSYYSGHFCLGIIYTRADFNDIVETEIFRVEELEEDYKTPYKNIGLREITNVSKLKSITSVIKDFDFFVTEKWEIASEREGSKNTANIGSITYIDDLKKGNGIFAKLGEQWFDEYWINYGSATMVKDGKTTKITKLKDFLEFKSQPELIDKIVSRKSKRKMSKK